MAAASHFVVQTIKDVTVVELADASILDTQQIEHLGLQLNEFPQKQAIRKLVVDFAKVKFLSSSALGVFLTLRRKCDEIKGKLAIANMRPELVRVFKVTKLDDLFAFFASQEKALNWFGVDTAEISEKG